MFLITMAINLYYKLNYIVAYICVINSMYSNNNIDVSHSKLELHIIIKHIQSNYCLMISIHIENSF